jgi:hypothetical protein
VVNLTLEELQQLHELLTAFEASEEFQEVVVTSPEDLEAVKATLNVINYVRVSRPEESKS